MNSELSIGDEFQQQTKYYRHRMPFSYLDLAIRPERYKIYPRAPKITLEEPETDDGPGIWQVVQQRRSYRDFVDDAITKADLSQLLWASQGITHVEHGYELRAAPSAGALYPIETYLVINNVKDVEEGIYHYNVKEHCLEQIKAGHYGEAIAHAALDQSMCARANVTFIWTAIFQRSKWKYSQRAYRYIYLDAGHIAHAVALAAVALGLASCQIAALYDDEVNAFLDLDGKEESVVYMSVVGKKGG